MPDTPTPCDQMQDVIKKINQITDRLEKIIEIRRIMVELLGVILNILPGWPFNFTDNDYSDEEVESIWSQLEALISANCGPDDDGA